MYMVQGWRQHWLMGLQCAGVRVKLNFLRQGIHVQDHESDPRKRPVVTGIPREKSKEVTNHHYEKQQFLITQQPEIYGTTQKYLPIPQQE